MLAAVQSTSGTNGDLMAVLTPELKPVMEQTFPGLGEEVITNVDRRAFRRSLLSGIADRVHFGRALERYRVTDAGRIHARFADGSEAEADLLVGADGVGSPVRRQLLPDAEIRDLGLRCIYGQMPITEATESLIPAAFHRGFVWVADDDGGGVGFAPLRFRSRPDLVGELAEDYLMVTMLTNAPEVRHRRRRPGRRRVRHRYGRELRLAVHLEGGAAVMKISTLLTYGTNPREAADHVVELEAAGLDTVWVAEGYGFDSPTLMGLLAARTSTVEIGAAILNIYSRTPTMLASTAAGLDSVSDGRAIIGLGASNPKIIEGWHGLPFTTPVSRTKETVEIIRAALRHEVIDHHGRFFDLPLPAGQGTGVGTPLAMMTKPERPSVPLYLAALGPKSVEGAAAYADGWLPFLYSPEGAAKVWGDSLASGAARRSADLAPLQVVAAGMVAVGEDVKETLDLARPVLALYIGGMGARGKNFFNDLACQYRYEAEAREIQDLYLDGKKKEAAAKVPLELLEQVNLVGPASYVKERIEAFRDSGVTNLQVTPVADDPAALVRQLKEWVV